MNKDESKSNTDIRDYSPKRMFVSIFTILVLLSASVILIIMYTDDNSNGELITSGSCGDDLEYTLKVDFESKKGTLIIEGIGPMYDWRSESHPDDAPWFKNVKHANLVSVSIGNGVTTIGDYAFSGCSGLTGSLNLPSGITYIGINAFNGCSKITGMLNLPSSITDIGSGAFYGCSGLTGTLTIPGSIKTIGLHTFENCTGIRNIMICDGVNIVDSFAFRNCKSLTFLTIPKSVTSIDRFAFDGCTFYCEDGITKITDNSQLPGFSYRGDSPDKLIRCDTPQPQNDNTALTIGIVIGVIIVIALIGGAIFFMKKK